MPLTPPLNALELASLPSAVGFIKEHSQTVAEWLGSGFANGDNMPDDIQNVEKAAQHLRWLGEGNGPYPEGAASVAERLTSLIQGGTAPANTAKPEILSISVTGSYTGEIS